MNKRHDWIEVFPNYGGWYWRRKAPNGRKLSGGMEQFSSRRAAVRAARRANPDIAHLPFRPDHLIEVLP